MASLTVLWSLGPPRKVSLHEREEEIPCHPGGKSIDLRSLALRGVRWWHRTRFLANNVVKLWQGYPTCQWNAANPNIPNEGDMA